MIDPWGDNSEDEEWDDNDLDANPFNGEDDDDPESDD